MRRRFASPLSAASAAAADRAAAVSASTSSSPPPPPPAPPPFFLAFGDLGLGSADDAAAFQQYGAAARLLPALLNADVAAGAAFIALYGDLSYAVGWLQVWDEFVGLVSAFMRACITLVSPGNHEAVAPRSASWALFGAADDSGGEANVVAATLFPPPAPASARAPWFVFSSGPFAVLALSSEHDWRAGSAQHAWLAAALAAVDRRATPWVVLTLHRQIYTDTILDDALNYTALFRAHIEPLTQRFQVPLVLAGHAHKWERLSATVGGRVDLASQPRPGAGGADVHVFAYPRAPVHFIAGMGGADRVVNDCRRFRQAPYFLNCTVPAFSEEEGYDHGYLRVAALNETALLLEYVASDTGPNVTAGGGGAEGVGGLGTGRILQTIVILQNLTQPWEEG